MDGCAAGVEDAGEAVVGVVDVGGQILRSRQLQGPQVVDVVVREPVPVVAAEQRRAGATPSRCLKYQGGQPAAG
jgi:hypothetical protein